MGVPPREEKRHPGRTVAREPPPRLSSLPPFFFRQERRAYAGEIPRLWILSTNVKRSLVLSVPLCPTPFRPLSSTKSTLRLPLECNEIWHVPFITADILLSFGHTFLAARSRVWNSFFFSLFLFLFLSFILHVLTKVLSTVIATTIWILEPHKARSKRTNRDNIFLDMQIFVVQ